MRESLCDENMRCECVAWERVRQKCACVTWESYIRKFGMGKCVTWDTKRVRWERDTRECSGESDERVRRWKTWHVAWVSYGMCDMGDWDMWWYGGWNCVGSIFMWGECDMEILECVIGCADMGHGRVWRKSVCGSVHVLWCGESVGRWEQGLLKFVQICEVSA